MAPLTGCQNLIQSMPNQHGGPRPVVRKDDGRLTRKLVEPQRISILLEAAQVEWLRKQAPTLSEAVRAIITKEILK